MSTIVWKGGELFLDHLFMWTSVYTFQTVGEVTSVLHAKYNRGHSCQISTRTQQPNKAFIFIEDGNWNQCHWCCRIKQMCGSHVAHIWELWIWFRFQISVSRCNNTQSWITNHLGLGSIIAAMCCHVQTAYMLYNVGLIKRQVPKMGLISSHGWCKVCWTRVTSTVLPKITRALQHQYQAAAQVRILKRQRDEKALPDRPGVYKPSTTSRPEEM